MYKHAYCGSCGGAYQEDGEFRIMCEVCDLWYHGECVSVTNSMAEKIGKYKCPSCTLKRTNRGKSCEASGSKSGIPPNVSKHDLSS
ncbi:putative chromatin regulator PHD family [Helianthus annuus]|uniref:PHD finger protein ALFIN-LIKE n=1 Tax=Helianthus annuus TaxID=4232 RepID=A0A9K3J9B6_HELAN|nr:putative chromatin regulator PHD family [Helianthus annuus]KAJ0931973.1 putative chromatin regulator PHD family [Helianthus annuus]